MPIDLNDLNLARLTAAQKAPAADLFTRSFQDDPAYTHIFPDPQERSRALRRVFDGVLTVALRYGQVDTTTGLHGVACWTLPGQHEVTLWR